MGKPIWIFEEDQANIIAVGKLTAENVFDRISKDWAGHKEE